jgi:hypothetical protein
MTTTFKFGSKVEFKNQDEAHIDLRDKYFCLIGFCDSAFALIDWDKRGSYDFSFYSGNVTKTLTLAEEQL